VVAGDQQVVPVLTEQGVLRVELPLERHLLDPVQGVDNGAGEPLVLPLTADAVALEVGARVAAFSRNRVPKVTAAMSATVSFCFSTSPPVRKLVDPSACLVTFNLLDAERDTSRTPRSQLPSWTDVDITVLLVALEGNAGCKRPPIAADDRTSGSPSAVASTVNRPPAVRVAPSSTLTATALNF
jgi:hypothetical protein